MKDDNKKTNNQKKSYSSKNSKYLQQAQKLFDDDKKNKQVQTKNVNKTTQNNKQSQVKTNVASKNQSNQNKKNVTQKKNNSVNKNVQNKKKNVNDNVKNVEDVKSVIAVKNETKKVPKSNKVSIEEGLPKLDQAKVQEAAKKKTLELVEELKLEKNKGEAKKVKVAEPVKKESRVSKNKNVANKTTVKSSIKKNDYSFDDLKKESIKKDSSDDLLTNSNSKNDKEDKLIEKLQEELNQKDLEIINEINIDEPLTEVDEVVEKVQEEKIEEEPPVIKKVDNELKNLIEEEEKKEKDVKISEDIKDESSKKTKKKKEVSKFVKVLKKIGLITLIFFVIASALLVYRVNKLGFLPMKYIFIAIAILSVISLIMLLFNITRSKFLHFLEILFTVAFGAVFIYGGIFINNINKSLKGIFSDGQEKAIYYVLVAEDSEYSSMEDLVGRNIGILHQNKDNVQDSLENYNLIYKEEYSFGLLTDLLLNNNKDVKLEAIVVPSSAYDNLSEINKEVYNKLRKIYEFETDFVHIEIQEDEFNFKFEKGEDEKEVEPEAPKRNPELLKDVDTSGIYTIFINGLDGRNSGKPAGLSDVNMIAIINSNTHKVLLVSIPRDYYVRVPGTTPGMRDKLSHSGIYGVNATMGALEGVFGIKLNEYVQFGFNAVPVVVDSIGGIDVYSDTQFNSFHMKGWTVPKGWVHLDGAKALAYARERYAYINQGDKHRVKNQQDVIQAIIKKTVTDPQQLVKFDQILSGIEPYFNTNISYSRMQEMVRQQLNTLTSWTVEKISVDGYDGYQTTASYPSDKAYVMYPYENTIVAAQQKILSFIQGN